MTSPDVFSSMRFKGKFRSYQQDVLDKMDVHLADGKVHVVAAPGSGKTILGLEMIRRVGKPAIIFSPSITIRQQWQDRFVSMFVPDGVSVESLFSCDIHTPGLLTSVTYQALHAAFTRQVESDKVEPDDEDEEAEVLDFQSFDLFAVMRQAGIGTICLDEAHHLRAEWQKALEVFISEVGQDMTIISLTATPPYDSDKAEWVRYESLCGPIDEEIFIPQLVAQGTLCPHQDYIYFNYPTAQESQLLFDYADKAKVAVNIIINDNRFTSLVSSSIWSNDEFLFEHVQGPVAVLCCLAHAGKETDQKLILKLTARKRLPSFYRELAEEAFQFILDNPDTFGPELIAFIHQELASRGLLIRKKVTLCTTKQLSKTLAASLGKLDSIKAIVASEYGYQGDTLRMLILTDFIKSATKRIIGTDQEIGEMGTVTIFEAIRRANQSGLRIAVLSGGLTIVPLSVVSDLRVRAQEMGITFSESIFPNTDYCELLFSSSNKNKVALITEAFQSGLFHVVIGTKSLLGEGWDSPCINTLILASFVGSFMLSNQMRGRAIRIDSVQPNKTANIWHLVTIDPSLEHGMDQDHQFIDENVIHSPDFAVCKRKFNAFMAPAYHDKEITSGIERCDIIKPPYSESTFDLINSQMLSMARDRESMRQSWNNVVNADAKYEVTEAVRVPKPIESTKAVYQNFFIVEAVFTMLGLLFVLFYSINLPITSLLVAYLSINVMAIYLIKLLVPRKRVENILESLLATLKKTGVINSRTSKIEMESDNQTSFFICELVGGTQHEKTLFAEAMNEMFSPIDNPKYLLIGIKDTGWEKHKYHYSDSYACPSVISNNKSSVELFVEELKKRGLEYIVVFTRNEKGRSDLLSCRQYSLRNHTTFSIFGNKRLRLKKD